MEVRERRRKERTRCYASFKLGDWSVVETARRRRRFGRTRAGVVDRIREV